jgi:hypothetical protein
MEECKMNENPCVEISLSQERIGLTGFIVHESGHKTTLFDDFYGALQYAITAAAFDQMELVIDWTVCCQIKE